jgi:hypothetical protein
MLAPDKTQSIRISFLLTALNTSIHSAIFTTIPTPLTRKRLVPLPSEMAGLLANNGIVLVG